MSAEYSIRYTVTAGTYLEAIGKATAMLRTGIKLRGIRSVSAQAGGIWTVVLSVWEDV